MAFIKRQQWATDQQPVVTFDAANKPAQTIDGGLVSSALRGPLLGSVLQYQTKPSWKAKSEAIQTHARQSPAS